MIKEITKGQRKRAYASGLLAVPREYTYLKANASHRDPEGSRIKHAKRVPLASASAGEKRKRDEAADNSHKRARTDSGGHSTSESGEFVQGTSFSRQTEQEGGEK
jgi:hypothetical protein